MGVAQAPPLQMCAVAIRIRHSASHASAESNMVSYVNVKSLPILCCLLSIALAMETQVKLEDIERDNLNSENQSNQHQRQVKTFQDLPPRQFYGTQQPETYTGPQQFTPDAQRYSSQPLPQDVLQSTPLQFLQELAAGAKYPGEQQQQQYQYQYVTDNSLLQTQYVPQYYSQSGPQYVYLPAGNNAPVQGKPGIQYADPNTEYLRSPHIQANLAKYQDQSHNLAGLIQRTAYTNVLPNNYRSPAPQTYRLAGLANQEYVNQNVYVLPQPTATTTLQPVHPVYQRTSQVLAQQRYLVPGVTYRGSGKPVYEQQQQQQQAQQSIANVVYEKREPKSLLDSYVPSILQVQYYKQLQQLQQQANAIPQDGKLAGNLDGKSGAGDYLAGSQYANGYQFVHGN